MRYLCILILAFQFVFLLRMVLSFFPLQEGTPPARVRELAMAATEPVVLPIRRALPPLPGALAGFGVAELVVLFGIYILSAIVC